MPRSRQSAASSRATRPTKVGIQVANLLANNPVCRNLSGQYYIAQSVVWLNIFAFYLIVRYVISRPLFDVLELFPAYFEAPYLWYFIDLCIFLLLKNEISIHLCLHFSFCLEGDIASGCQITSNHFLSRTSTIFYKLSLSLLERFLIIYLEVWPPEDAPERARTERGQRKTGTEMLYDSTHIDSFMTAVRGLESFNYFDCVYWILYSFLTSWFVILFAIYCTSVKFYTFSLLIRLKSASNALGAVQVIVGLVVKCFVVFFAFHLIRMYLASFLALKVNSLILRDVQKTTERSGEEAGNEIVRLWKIELKERNTRM